jgi:ABC-type amino acid transport substrate-binding protein
MTIYRGAYLALAVMFLTTLFATLSGCSNKQENDDGKVIFTSLRDIPGITDEEIKAVDELRKKYGSFTYGMLVSTETFIDVNGEIRGFTTFFCDWLTELFDIPFIPQIREWDNLMPTLTADFTGELTPTEKRRTELGYFFTDAITERSAKYFRIPGSTPRWEILKSRPLKLAFLEDSSTSEAAIAKLNLTSVPHEAFYFGTYAEAYEMLKNNEVDAVVDEMVSETAFDEFGGVVGEDFFPLIYEPVALATQNPELAPIISIIQKALKNGGRNHLADIYEQGEKDYARHKFFLQLTEQELKYLKEHKAVKYLAEYDNYPLSFYNHNERQWQGVAFDVLHEVSDLTELTFEPIHKPDISFADLMHMLENHEGDMLSEVIPTPQRQGRFLWPSHDTMRDNYVAISRDKAPKINIHRITLLKVGVQKGTAYSDLFSMWFPNHPNVIEYDDTNAAFRGLEKGEIDILMYSMRNLLTATHYHERPGFKAAIVFEYTFSSNFGFNKDEEILCSIVDKAMGKIDLEAISSRWVRKTFDYRAKVANSQRPWLMGTVGLFFVVIVLTLALYLRSQNTGKRLDILVQQRTAELDISREHLRAALHDAEAANHA